MIVSLCPIHVKVPQMCNNTDIHVRSTYFPEISKLFLLEFILRHLPLNNRLSVYFWVNDSFCCLSSFFRLRVSAFLVIVLWFCNFFVTYSIENFRRLNMSNVFPHALYDSEIWKDYDPMILFVNTIYSWLSVYMKTNNKLWKNTIFSP